MYQITGRIQGVAPFLYNRMANDEGLRGAGAGGGKLTEEQRIAEAMLKVHRNEHGLIIPAWNFKKCLVLGCAKANLKEGRYGLAGLVEATVFVEGDLCFGKDDPDFLHEVVGRIPPRTGAAAIIRRPALDTGWELPFTLNVMDDRRSSDYIRRGLEEAGLLVGLGSWRPEYGRFIVTEWEKQAA